METTCKKKKKGPESFLNFYGLIIIFFFILKNCLQISLCSTMHENTKKTGEIIFSVAQNRTCKLPQLLRDFDDYAIM